MYRRILVASDFSAPATAGARLAASLSARGAALLAVHVVPDLATAPYAPALGLDPVPPFGWTQATRDITGIAPDDEQARARLQEWIGEIGLPLDAHLAHGDAPRVLLKEAEDFAADLIVLGARGHSRLEDVLLGSTARHVLRHARADVLLAEETSAHPGPPRRIALATSFDDASQAAARRAREVAEATNAELLILHAIGPGVQTGASYGLAPIQPPLVEDPERTWHEVEAKLDAFNREQLDGRATILLGRGHMDDEISRLAHEGRADLLVMGHHHSGFFERLLLGSVSEALARHPPCSTLFVQT